MSGQMGSASLSRLMSSLWVPQAIFTAAALGIADVLAEQPATSDHLAAAVGAHPGALHRLLRGLVALELCTTTGDGTFAGTCQGEGPVPGRRAQLEGDEPAEEAMQRAGMRAHRGGEVVAGRGLLGEDVGDSQRRRGEDGLRHPEARHEPRERCGSHLPGHAPILRTTPGRVLEKSRAVVRLDYVSVAPVQKCDATAV